MSNFFRASSGNPSARVGPPVQRKGGPTHASGPLRPTLIWLSLLSFAPSAAWPAETFQHLERTCFQTGGAYRDAVHLGSDVAIVYGIDPGLPKRIESWREKGYRIHVMTGVSWGNYQDYLYGRFDGVNHEDEAQTDRHGNKISHGGDVYYMCPGENFGKFLCVGVQRALDAKAEAIHLEEPEFWVRGGYSEGFKREWKAYYGEDWTPPHSSVDAQWRASKLKYFLYRRALQQVFDFIQESNRRTGRPVRCYVPSHSLLSYAHWRIVSPESSLAQLQGCDGYIAQVWTGTSRTPNVYRGQLRERTFETAFLEYGVMQNLVRATGRTVWYLNDPVEDNPDHDWGDYQRNWESTLVASLLQPEVWRYEVMPWPERVWTGRYPSANDTSKREPIPPAYALELQTVINTLNDMNQPEVAWDCGTTRIGLLVSDSLMFQRGDPSPSDTHLSHVYGLALPFLKRGMPIAPVQLENLPIPGALNDYDLLVLSYHGMKPLEPAVHAPLADWVKAGGVLVVWDDDTDPFNAVREWWNTAPLSFQTPRQHLFEQLGLEPDAKAGRHQVGKGTVLFQAANPATLAAKPDGDVTLLAAVKQAVHGSRVRWSEANYLLLRRGPYLVGAGLDESVDRPAKVLEGSFVDLFDANLPVRNRVTLTPGSRRFLIDLAKVPSGGPKVVAAACKTLPEARLMTDPGAPKQSSEIASGETRRYRVSMEGIANTPGLILLRLPNRPSSAELEKEPLAISSYDPATGLTWLKFDNQPRRRDLVVYY